MPENLEGPRRQVGVDGGREGRASGSLPGRGRHAGAAGQREPDRPAQLAGCGRPLDPARQLADERGRDRLRGSHRHQAGSRRRRPQLARHRRPALEEQAHPDDHGVGEEATGLGHQARAVDDAGDDLEVVAEQACEALPDEALLLADQHPRSHRSPSRTRAQYTHCTRVKYWFVWPVVPALSSVARP